MTQQPIRDSTSALDQLTQAQLIFPNGIAPLVTLRGDTTLEQLFHTHFERPIPEINNYDNNLIVQYHHKLFFTELKELLYPPKPAYIDLNPSISWKIMIKGGASRINADLREIDLRGFEIHGGVNELKLLLPQPAGTVPIRILQGAANVTIYHLSSIPLKVQISGGASNLIIDDQIFKAVGSSTNWEQPDYKRATDRFDIKIKGGAANLTISSL